MREKKYEEIVCFCKEHDVDFVTLNKANYSLIALSLYIKIFFLSNRK